MRSSRRVPAAARARALAAGGRLRTAGWSIVQCALGAPSAWLFSVHVLGHPAPFFASVGCVVCLSVSQAQRLRRVVEMAAGVSIGVAIAEQLMQVIGHGWWQIGVVVLLGMAAAQLVGGGPLIANQAALQAVFVVVLPAAPGSAFVRWQDALVGGATALVIAAGLPADPRRAVQQRARQTTLEVAGVLGDTSRAIRTGDPDVADAALHRARATQATLERWDEALRSGEEVSRISPLRRHSRRDLLGHRRALTNLDLAVRNLRVAVRRVDALLLDGDPVPARIADVLDDLAGALVTLGAEIPGPAPGTRAALSAVAGRLDPAALCAGSLSATVVVAQVRSSVVDLLGATGMPYAEARRLLPPATPVTGTA